MNLNIGGGYMEWEKAKTIVIVFLVILNSILGFLWYKNSLKYTLDDEQKKNIITLLENKDISLNTDFIEKHDPMKKLELTVNLYDERDILKIFFKEGASPENKGDNYRPVYETGDEVLAINQNIILYSSNMKGEKLALDRKAALKLCQDFIDKMGDKGKGYKLDIIPEDISQGGTIIYTQRINKNIIYNNYIKFTVGEYGISNVEYSYGLPVGYSGDTREIASCDEALFTFMVTIRNETTEKISIEKIDLVYFKEEDTQTGFTAVPCYRVLYKRENTPEGSYNIMLINAYTNKIEGHE
ncbi:MAG: hypothetical protein E7234_11695 [Lachnospiraceae bacterium]|jgi:regulatory protein YycI of two-component signal transduction system YycFG|nr:hypothetical protein [Lachnospiraceae bacterium]